MYHDLKHALRLWTSRPWQTVFAIAALAIGIGANTGVFSVVNALLLRSLPFRDPERLALLQRFLPPHNSEQEFHGWRQRSSYLADAALVEQADATLGGVQKPGRVHISQTSWNFFSTAGISPLIGRSFLPGEDSGGIRRVAILGYGLWQQLFGGDPGALGKTIQVGGTPLTIIGVAPPGFDYPGRTALWTPAVFSPGNNGWETLARLKPGWTWTQARAAFDAEAEHLAPARGPVDPKLRPAMTPLQNGLAGPARKGSLILMAAVVLVLLIACTNVASLLMARAAERASELSIRTALGASGWRLARQLLTECLLLAAVAGACGLVVAFWTASFAAKVQPPPLGSQAYVVLDSRVLAFAALASIASCLLFGVLPSLFARRFHSYGVRAASHGSSSRLMRESSAAAQVALTVILLAASVSVGQAFWSLMRADRGYNVKGVVTVNVSLDGTAQQQNRRQLAYFEEALARVRRIPGVESASATEFLPLYASGFIGGRFGLDGRPARRASMVVPVMGGYFQTMGGRIRFGREFTDAEVHAGASLAVVDERFAAEFGAPRDAIGRKLTAGRRTWTIVGVAEGMAFETDPSVSAEPQNFVPSSTPGGFFSTIVARVDSVERLAAVRDAIRSVDPQVSVFGASTMEQRLADTFERPRFYRTAIWLFAGFALLVAVIGIYATVSYGVAQRTREIGVRLALGTTPARLRGMVLRQGLVTVIAGALPGIAGALLSGRLLTGLMEGAAPAGVAPAILAACGIACVAVIAIWRATRRIAVLDIATALRCE